MRSCSHRGFCICLSGPLPRGLSRCEVATTKRRPLMLSSALRMLAQAIHQKVQEAGIRAVIDWRGTGTRGSQLCNEVRTPKLSQTTSAK